MTIIALPTVSSARLGRSRSTMPDLRLLVPCRTVQRLLSDIDAAAAEASPADWAQGVADLLAQSLAAPDCLAGLRWGAGVGGKPARLDLAESRSLRIFARRWQPGQVGPLRRFMDWFAYGVAAGRLTELRYPEGHGPGAGDGSADGLPPGCRDLLTRGAVRHGPGDGRRLQCLANRSDRVAVSLHIEGLPQMVRALSSAVMPIELGPQPSFRPGPRLTLLPGGRAG